MKFKEYLKESKEEIIKKIKEFFKKNPKPSDDEVHEFAEEMGIDTHKFEEYIYMIMGKMVKEDKFKDIRKELLDDTMKYTGSGEYDKNKVKKLYKIDDPKKFITAFKSLTGAYNYDLPKKLLSLIKEDKVKGGIADKKKPEDFDQKELKLGIKIEMEHTDDPELAKEIAMDHLTEMPDYYTRLEKMEKEAEKE